VLAYQPVLLAQAGIRYQDKKSTVYTTKTYAFHVPSLERSGLVHWENFQTAPVETQRVSGEPFGQALFGELAPGLTDAKRMNALRSEVVDMLYSTARLQIPFNPTLGVYGKVDAPESEFHAAIQQAAREARDQEVDTIAAKYEKEMDKVEDRLRKESRDLEAQKKELADLKREELFTRGEAIISLFKGRTAYTLSRSSRVTRFRRQAGEQLTESEQQIVEYEQALETLQQRFNQEIQTVNERWARVAVEIQPYVISPYKKDIQLELFGIGWVPYFYVQLNGQPLLLQAWY
jgi:septin family protein